jgi:transcriptional regulator with XRE-family HTH domain/tetratricopeptide (TPR) repeat protein
MPEGFAALLRTHRLRLQLTQEALAERAGISSRSIREMERGQGRGPRPSTVQSLAEALALAGPDRDELVAAGNALYWASRSSARTPPAHEPAAHEPVPRQLPADLPDFVGREAEVAAVCSALEQTGRAAISGPPGVGKTALAVHVGHLLAPRYPDGQLFVNVRAGTGDPTSTLEVLAQLLRTLGVHGSALPRDQDARAGLLRTRLAGLRVLLVVDDAAGHRQVEPLLPVGDAALLVTGRPALTGLPGVATVDLAPLPPGAGIGLLGRVAGVDRVEAEPAAAAELVAACGGLPLAVRIAAARLAARPQWTVAALAERLADERGRLDELRHGDLAVRTNLEVAYRGLTPAAARALALLGELDVPTCPEWTVAALLGADPAAGSTVLGELLDAGLLASAGTDQAGQERYRLHDVIRLFARERRAAQVDRADWVAALDRAATGWLALARQAQDGLECERFGLDDRAMPAAVVDPRSVAAAAGQPVAWFEAEREALAALVPACATLGLAAMARALAGCAIDFYEMRAYYEDCRAVTEAALAACRAAGDRRGEAALTRGLGSCLVGLGDLEAAIATLRGARAIAAEVGDAQGAARSRRELGFALGLCGHLEEAEQELREAVAELETLQLTTTQALAMSYLAFVLRERGDTTAALATHRAGLRVARSNGDRYAQAYIHRGLAAALLSQAPHDAERAACQAAELFAQIGDDIGRAHSLRTQGEALARQPGREVAAERVLREAADLFQDRGNEWGLTLCELSIGEIEAGRGTAGAAERLRRALEYWTRERVPALAARTLVALANAAEKAGDPASRELLHEAYRIYQELDAPETAEIAARLGLSGENSTT